MLDRTKSRALRRARDRRRYRRQAAGLAVVPVEVSTAVIAHLVRLNWLDDTAAGDAHCIGAAISKMLIEAASAGRK